MQTQDEDVLELSPEAQAALAAFGRDRGLPIEEGEDVKDLVRKVHESCMPEDKEEKFEYKYGDDVVIKLNGWKKELGQRLNSTGLTIWRAAEDLARYLYEKREGLFQDGSRHVIELGAGLGLCGLLAARLNPSGVVVLSDGDELTMERLTSNIEANVVKNKCAVTPRLLRWGDHAELASEFPDGFGLVLAADVLYEEEAVRPLLTTAKALLKRSPDARFILAFARRNVRVDDVIAEAERLGFCVEKDDSFTCSVVGESIYVLRLRD